jgi:hypothetical protein
MFVDPSGTNTTVTGAIRQAARLTGANFQYLLATAQVESNLNPNAQVSTSSARGLFQFIEQTWLGTLKEQGPALGYAPYASAISRLPSGEYTVADPRMRAAVMNLRSDPTANALMAGAFTRINAGKLAERLGRDPTEGELYIAHFLGPIGASQLVGLAESQPDSPAAAAFPGAARANPSIFYDRQGRARGAGEVYRELTGRYGVARNGPVNAAATVAASAAPAAATAAATTTAETAPTPAATVAATLAEVDPALLAQTYVVAMPPAAELNKTGPVFHGLFRSNGPDEAVAPVVRALWAAPALASAADPAQAAGAPQNIVPAAAGDGALNLFQDQAPDVGALFRGRA